MVDWLQISKTEGEGDAIITLTASTYMELEDRVALLTVSGNGISRTLSVSQKGFAVDHIYFSIISWDIDVPSEGGIADKDNCTYVIYAEDSLGNKKDISNIATISGSTVVEKSMNPVKHIAGTLTLTASYGGATASTEINIVQAGFDASKYVKCVYDIPDTDDYYKLFGTSGSDYNYYTRSVTIVGDGITSEPYLDAIFVEDGEWPFEKQHFYDLFTFNTVGRHTAYFKFKDNTINVNPRSNTNDELSHYIPQNPWQGNTNLREIYIPSGYTLDGVDNLFADCINLEKVVIESDGFMTDNFCTGIVREAPTGLTTCNMPTTWIGSKAFYGCTALNNVGNMIGDATLIDTEAFYGCTALPITVLNVEDKEVLSDAFNGCTQIKDIYVGNNSNIDAYEGCGENGTLYWNVDETAYLLSAKNAKFRKIVCLTYPNSNSTSWFDYNDGENPYLEEVEFLPTTQGNWIYDFGGSDVAIQFAYATHLNKIIMHGPQPIKNRPTSKLWDINYGMLPSGGTLVYPIGEDYSQFLSTDEGWLGSRGWNGVQPTEPSYTFREDGFDAIDTIYADKYGYEKWITVSQDGGYSWDGLWVKTDNLPDWVSILSNNKNQHRIHIGENSGDTRNYALTYRNKFGETASVELPIVQIGAYSEPTGITITATQKALISYEGGTVSKDNFDYTVVANYDGGYIKDITYGYDVIVTGTTLTVPPTTAETEEVVGSIVITATYNEFTNSVIAEVKQGAVPPPSIHITSTNPWTYSSLLERDVDFSFEAIGLTDLGYSVSKNAEDTCSIWGFTNNRIHATVRIKHARDIVITIYGTDKNGHRHETQAIVRQTKDL